MLARLLYIFAGAQLLLASSSVTAFLTPPLMTKFQYQQPLERFSSETITARPGAYVPLQKRQCGLTSVKMSITLASVRDAVVKVGSVILLPGDQGLGWRVWIIRWIIFSPALLASRNAYVAEKFKDSKLEAERTLDDPNWRKKRVIELKGILAKRGPKVSLASFFLADLTFFTIAALQLTLITLTECSSATVSPMALPAHVSAKVVAVFNVIFLSTALTLVPRFIMNGLMRVSLAHTLSIKVPVLKRGAASAITHPTESVEYYL